MKYVCEVCGYVYDSTIGDLSNNIKPGTGFKDFPENYRCPICGVGKEDFTLLEELVNLL